MDITAVYDNVQINILCNIMSELHLPRIIVKMIFLLFQNRHLHIYHNNQQVYLQTESTGLAQGSTLSLLLFNIYTVNIDKFVTNDVQI